MSNKRNPTPVKPAETVPAGPAATTATQAVAEASVVTLPAVETAPAQIAGDADNADLGDLVEVRVTLAFDGHEPDAVIKVPVGKLDELKGAGHVDDHPDAVAYARSLQA